MGARSNTVCNAGRKYEFTRRTYQMVFLKNAPDTPWRRPTTDQKEFERYICGEYVKDKPWSSFSKTTMGNNIILIDVRSTLKRLEKSSYRV